MAVFVDNERIAWRGRMWCHLVADTLAELHAFAGRLGLRREWFQGRASYPHYDITVTLRIRALRIGALQADRTQLLICCRKLKSEMLLTQQGDAALSSQVPLQGVLPWTSPSTQHIHP